MVKKMAYKAISQSAVSKVESQTKLPFERLVRRSYSPLVWPAVKQKPERRLTIAVNKRLPKRPPRTFFLFCFHSIFSPSFFYAFSFFLSFSSPKSQSIKLKSLI